MKIEFKTGNDAFSDGQCAEECAGILLRLAARLKERHSGSTQIADEGRIMDSNGNCVGKWSIDHDDGDAAARQMIDSLEPSAF